MYFPAELIHKQKTSLSTGQSSLEGGVRRTEGVNGDDPQDQELYLTTDHLFQLRVIGHCEINGRKYRDKLFSKCYSTAWVSCQDDQLLATSENGYCVLIPID